MARVVVGHSHPGNALLVYNTRIPNKPAAQLFGGTRFLTCSIDVTGLGFKCVTCCLGLLLRGALGSAVVAP